MAIKSPSEPVEIHCQQIVEITTEEKSLVSSDKNLDLGNEGICSDQLGPVRENLLVELHSCNVYPERSARALDRYMLNHTTYRTNHTAN